MGQTSKPLLFWRNFIEAVEACPVDTTVIKGASGLEHGTLGIGIDVVRKRLIFISQQQDPRALVLIRGDIQAGMPGFYVVGARVSISNPARDMAELIQNKGPEISLQDKTFLSDLIGCIFKPEIFKRAKELGIFALNDITEIDFGLKYLNKAMDIPQDEEGNQENRLLRLLSRLKKFNPIQHDIKYGICPIPIYEFSDNHLQTILEARNAQAVQEILLTHDVLQYFLPSPDHLALGLVESGISKKDDLLSELERTPKDGHPYKKPEITEAKDYLEMIDELQERKLLVEGKFTYEITQEGTTLRNTVKFKPREALISKIINRFKINVDFKSIFSIGK